MRQYWWVNHKQTFRQEIGGQYLWSPKREANGARSQFYDNMRLASPGDRVLSYANGQISYIGRVTEFAFSAPKPEEFGTIGSYWDREGWLLPVFWTPLSPPVRPKDLIVELGPQLPQKYSPIQASTGAGNQKVYLANISEAAFDTVVNHTTFSTDALAHGGSNSLTFEIVNERLEDIIEHRVLADLTLAQTVKESVVQARRGQGRFRANVEKLEQACRLTGITNPALLIASHIKPWRLCESAEERLDGHNGLLLTPDADLLFDRGFISFEPDGRVLVSERVPAEDLRRLGFEQLAWQRFGTAEAPAIWRTETFEDRRGDYLEFHRSQVFIQ